MAYYPLNWYWVVGDDTTKVWSSARAEYVPTDTDQPYFAWLQANPEGPSTIGSQQELIEVILDQWLPMVADAGLAVVCDSDASLSGVYPIDQTGQANIIGISAGITAGKPLPSGNNTFKFRDIDGVPHVFSGESFTSFAAAAETYIYGVQDALEERIMGNTAPMPTQPVHFE